MTVRMTMPARYLIVAALGAAGLILGGCQKDYEARSDTGVCYRVVLKKDGSPDYVEVARNQARIEDCAARLDEVRYRFLSLGSNRHEIVGSYQGRFLFIDQAGLSYSQTLKGNQYIALGRLPDGRLAVPGLMPAPAPATGPGGDKTVTITQNPTDLPPKK